MLRSAARDDNVSSSSGRESVSLALGSRHQFAVKPGAFDSMTIGIHADSAPVLLAVTEFADVFSPRLIAIAPLSMSMAILEVTNIS